MGGAACAEMGNFVAANNDSDPRPAHWKSLETELRRSISGAEISVAASCFSLFLCRDNKAVEVLLPPRVWKALDKDVQHISVHSTMDRFLILRIEVG